MAVERPIWDTLIGCQRPLAELRSALEQGRDAHAWLFCGADGVGKRTCALGLAQRLNCRADAPPCGQCESCRRMARRAHPELRPIEPEEQGEGGRSLVHKIETIRELQADSHLRPFGDAVRVYLLNAAERMTEAAANCLLKTLEEPPEQVVLVLCCEEPSALLPTIRSRVRRVDFPPASRAEIADWLRREHGLADDQAELCAGIAAGRPGRALVLAGDPAVREFRTRLYEQMSRLERRPPAAALSAAATIRGGLGAGREGAATELALEMLEWWYRDALLVSVGGPAALVSTDCREPIERFAAGRSPAELSSALTALHSARLAWRRNANVALLLEVLWLRLAGALGSG